MIIFVFRLTVASIGIIKYILLINFLLNLRVSIIFHGILIILKILYKLTRIFVNLVLLHIIIINLFYLVS